MKKSFVALLISASLAACGSKKENTTPANKPAVEQKDDAAGGAAYGGKKADGTPAADPANPSAPK